jgi:hypothetical protein
MHFTSALSMCLFHKQMKCRKTQASQRDKKAGRAQHKGMRRSGFVSALRGNATVTDVTESTRRKRQEAAPTTGRVSSLAPS